MTKPVFVLEGLPIPPLISKIKTYGFNPKTGKNFQRNVGATKSFYEVVYFTCLAMPIVKRREIRAWCEDPWNTVRLDAYFYLKKAALFSKKGTRKKTDPSNRLKALHDGLAKGLGVDDCHFTVGACEHVAFEGGGLESCAVEIYFERTRLIANFSKHRLQR